MDILECLFCGKRIPVRRLLALLPGVPRTDDVFAREAGNRRFHEDRTLPLERWLDFLPLTVSHRELGLGEGNTPFVRLTKLATEAGLPEFTLNSRPRTRP